jgi:hypothetical protein
MAFMHFISADKPGRDVRATHGLEGRVTINFNRLDKRIPHIPKVSLNQLMLNLIISQYGLCGRVPIDQPFAPINQPIPEEIEKRGTNGFDANFVHRKARSLPVTGAAHRLQLTDNAGFVFVFPSLNTPDKFMSLEVGTAFSFFR